MALSVDKAKDLKKYFLKRNVSKYLTKTYDWKVARAISTNEPLSDLDKAYRSSTIAEYNARLEALDAATSVDALKTIELKF